MRWPYHWAACSSLLLGALPLLCLYQAATTAGPLGFLHPEPAPPTRPRRPAGNGTVAARGGESHAHRHPADPSVLPHGASVDSFSSAFNINANSSCLIQPGAYTADPEPLPDCHQEPFAWEVDNVVRIQCPEPPIRWIEEGHEVLVNQHFSLKQVFNVEKDSPVWERLNHRAWRSGTPGRLRHTTEFLEVRCGQRRQLFVRLRPRANVAKRVPPPLGIPRLTRQPDVIVLLVDSVSRASFMRLCPQTAALLQSFALMGPHASHRAFVFSHAAALGASTAWNTYPLFAGLPFSLAQERQRLRTMAIGDLPAGHRWVWDEAQAAGYATAYVSLYGGLFGCRFWNNSFDHLMPGRLPYSQLRDFALKGRRGYDCLAGRPFTDLDFGYAHEFLEEPLYAAVPKFLYAHFDQAHDLEARAAWLDAPIAAAVQRILRAQPHSVVLLLSDHGGTPVHLPLLSLLVPVPLLATYPDWGSSLHANQDEVVSWYDVHATLRHLLHPDHQPPPPPTLQTARSLLTPLPAGRGCGAAGVPATFCPCMRIVPLPLGSPLSAGAVAALLADWNRRIPDGSSCLPLTVNQVVSAQEMISSTPDTVRHFDVQFTVQGDSYPVFALKSDLDRHTGRYSTVSATQQTRYERYRQCADPRVEITYCVCRVPPGTMASNV